MKTEFRAITTNLESNGRVISAYAARFGVLSQPLGNYRERIRPGAFTRALSDPNLDCRCLINHDPSKIIGRTTGGTLTLSQDSHGLRFSVDVAPTSFGDDLLTLCKRGDIDACSFGFIARDEAWPERGIRELLDCDVLDVSLVTYPAYPATAGVTIRGSTFALGWYETEARVIVPEVVSETEQQRLRLQLELLRQL